MADLLSAGQRCLLHHPPVECSPRSTTTTAWRIESSCCSVAVAPSSECASSSSLSTSFWQRRSGDDDGNRRSWMSMDANRRSFIRQPQIRYSWGSRPTYHSSSSINAVPRVVTLNWTRAKSPVVKSVAAAAAGKGNDSISSSSSGREIWEDGVSFNSRPDGETEGARGRFTQCLGVELVVDSQASEVAAVQHDAGILCVVMLGAFIWVRFFDYVTSRRILEQTLSRKIVHITSGMIYVLCWPLFSSSKWAPFIAGVVPLVNGLTLLIYGFGIQKNQGLVNSMSRSGEPSELLRGPLYYVLVLFISTVLFWRQSPVGVVALAMMCGGDGIADIMGRKFGSKKLPYNSDKSFAGSISMFLFGFLVSAIFVYYFTAFGFFKFDLRSAAVRLALISLASTVVESLPITKMLDDNFTVPATAVVFGVLLFPPTVA